ncbi:MAG: hypothetical protein MI700_04100 [Balneolales bacterium]|nr:hypothetical protein [Balneolales bacterium]
MRLKILTGCLIISSFVGYLEWGGDNHMFLAQIEVQILSDVLSKPGNLLHPFIILPLIGQVLLLISIFQKQPNRFLLYFGIIGPGLLFAMILFIGLRNMNVKIILSALPFFAFSIWILFHLRSLKKNIST